MSEPPARASGASWVALFASLALGCDSYDADLLKRSGDRPDSPEPTEMGDAGGPRLDAAPPSSCVSVGAERCNGQDDDCDGRTDELADGSCLFAHATGACVATGACALVECETGHFDCNGTKQDGCEAPLDEVDCGECGRVCSDAGAAAGDDDAGCTPEAAAESCDERDNDCDGTIDEGLLNSTEHCGTCGVSCSRDNGIASCQSGSCQLVGCAVGFTDCDGVPDNGCEPEPCSAAQTCRGLQPSSRGAACDACVCQACLSTAQNCGSNALCSAVLSCYANEACAECGGTSSASCMDCYASGNGPCAAAVNLAAGGASGTDTSMTASSCAGDPLIEPCAAALAFASCRNANCAAECP